MNTKLIQSIITLIALCCTTSAEAFLWFSKKQLTNKEQLDALQQQQIESPLNPLINYNVGVALYKEGKFSEAKENFIRALEHAKEHIPLIKRCYCNLGNTGYQKSITMLGSDWERNKIEQQVLLNAYHETKECIERYKSYLVLESDNDKVKENLGLAEELLKKIEKKLQQEQNKNQNNNKDNKNSDNKNKQKNNEQQKSDQSEQDKNNEKEQQSDQNTDDAQSNDENEQADNDQNNNQQESQGKDNQEEQDKQSDMNKKQPSKDQSPKDKAEDKKEQNAPNKNNEPQEKEEQKAKQTQEQGKEPHENESSPEREEAADAGTNSLQEQPDQETRAINAALANLDQDEREKQKKLIKNLMNQGGKKQEGQKSW